MRAANPLERQQGWTVVRSIVIVAVAFLGVCWAALSWRGGTAGILLAWWILPGLVVLHLTQLLLAGTAWRCLFAGSGGHRPDIGTFYRLRVIREGIDSLLPVAQIGGELVGARLLARAGVASGRAAASVVVDVTIELLTQVLFLFCGLGALALLSPAGGWGAWPGAVLAAAAAAGGLLLSQRFGLLAAIEELTRRIAGRWPALGSPSLAGLHQAAHAFYRQPAVLARATALHLLAWLLGTAESWAVLHLLAFPVTSLQALAIESLGMAARSAGFAIPAALGVQEGGFALAALAIGLPASAGLSLSLVKRIREVTTGLIGIALWRLAPCRMAAPPTAG